MNPFDAEKTKAVWDRVLATQEKAASVNAEGIKNTCHTMPEHQPAADSIQAEEIRDLIQDERTDACTYFALAKCAGGQNEVYRLTGGNDFIGATGAACLSARMQQAAR